MTIKKVISIPKIPQNLPPEIRKPLDQLRQAIIDLQQQTTLPVDGKDLIFGSVSQKKLTPELLIDVNAVRYYIEPLNGTSIKNSSGTLTIRAVRIDGAGTTILTAGPIKMFKPDGSIAGDGYTWTATAADITDSIIVTLKHQEKLTEWDTITLVDITDGGDAVIGAVDATNGLVWTRAIDAGAWVPVTTTTDLEAKFYLLGAEIASRTVRVTRSASGTLTAALEANNGEPTTHVITGSGTETLSVLFTHTASGATVIEAVLTVQGGDNGAPGAAGLNVATAYIYQRTPTDSAPTLPSATANYTFATGVITGLNNGWTDTIPAAGSDDFLWVSLATASNTSANDDIISGEWQAAVKLAETGAGGADGFNTATLTAYKRAAVAPTDDPGVSIIYTFATADWTPGNGWTKTIPAGADQLYALSATAFSQTATDTILSADWSTPTLILQDGADGVLHYLTNEAHVIPSNFDGGGYDTAFTGAGGTHKVFDGVTDVTTTAVHSINGSATKNGLTISVVSGTGVYSLSGSSWTTTIETFTVRAVFNLVNYDKTYTIVKAKQGADGGCAVDTLTTINLDDLGVNDPATVGFRLASAGSMFERANDPASYISKETWIGACANSEYECRYDHTGDALTGGSAAVNTWHLCSTTRTFELSTSGASKSAGGTFSIRRVSDNVVVATVSVNMDVERFV